MKQLCVALIMLSFAYNTVTAQTTSIKEPKLSASTKQFLWKLKKQNPENPTPIPQVVYKQDAQNNIYVSAIIKVYPGFNESALTALGVHINTKAGSIWTAQVPLFKMYDFTKVTGIQYIDMDQPVFQSLDSARRTTHVDSVQKGYGLSYGYDGKNVIVGVVDAGYDYTHPTLYDTSYRAYRVKRLWEEKVLTGTPPAGFSYGSEFTDSASILALGQDGEGTHGTHVTGIAAGSGYGSRTNSRFRGMAYGSDIALVAINPTNSYWLTTSMTDMLDGMNYLFKYAATESKPTVVNMSWGCPLGPHDGKSLFSQACDSLTGAGKIFVIAGGNEALDTTHFQKIFSSKDSIVNTFLTFSQYLSSKSNLLDIWGDSAQSFCIKFSLYSATKKVDSSLFICLDDTTHQINLLGSNGDTCFITLTTAAAEGFNNKPHMLLQVYSRANDSLCLTLKSDTGTLNIWQGYVFNNEGFYGAFKSFGYPWATNGDNTMSISDLAATKSIITVGAYCSKVNFTNISGQPLHYTGFVRGTLAGFSSLGPTVDGRTEPNITGPGMAVASSVTSYDSSFLKNGANYNSVISNFVSPLNGRTYSYAMLAGTSMSSPAVAGIIALLLEADPNLTPQDIKDVIDETAIIDKYTGTIPVGGSNLWGYGKINAYQALKKVLENEGIFHLQSSTLNCLVYPNPNNGKYAVDFVSSHEETLTLSVFDISGKQLLKENWNVNAGDNTHQFNLSAFPAGVYFTQLKSATGSAIIKIVKQ